MIAYARQCFPTAAVLVLGVSDRAVKNEKGVETMDAIPYMIDCQRTAARNQGAAFWSTFEAMQSQGGIEEFVARGWAGKDFAWRGHSTTPSTTKQPRPRSVCNAAASASRR